MMKPGSRAREVGRRLEFIRESSCASDVLGVKRLGDIRSDVEACAITILTPHKFNEVLSYSFLPFDQPSHELCNPGRRKYLSAPRIRREQGLDVKAPLSPPRRRTWFSIMQPAAQRVPADPNATSLQSPSLFYDRDKPHGQSLAPTRTRRMSTSRLR